MTDAPNLKETLAGLSAELEVAKRTCPANQKHPGDSKRPLCRAGPDSTCLRQDAAARLLFAAYDDAYRANQICVVPSVETLVLLSERLAHAAVEAANITTCDGYYEIDIKSAAESIRAILTERTTHDPA